MMTFCVFQTLDEADVICRSNNLNDAPDGRIFSYSAIGCCLVSSRGAFTMYQVGHILQTQLACRSHSFPCGTSWEAGLFSSMVGQTADVTRKLGGELVLATQSFLLYSLPNKIWTLRGYTTIRSKYMADIQHEEPRLCLGNLQ
jgi:hypothetical protein